MRGSTRRLTEELRAIKDRSGLSLTQIGARTHYSKASWERWFNGKRLITEQALESLAVTVDESALLLKPLLELALRESEAESAETPVATPATVGSAAVGSVGVGSVEEQASAPTAPSEAAVATAVAPAVVHPSAGGRDPWWRRHRRTALVAACSALVGGAVGAYVAAPGPAPSAQALGTHAPAPALSGRPSCAGVGCAGKDPQSTGCVKDSKSLITGNVGKIIIYLHYSPRCHAAWGGLTNASPGDFATIITTTGDQQTALVHWGYDNYSMMVDASDPNIGLKVCGTPGANKQVTGCTPEMAAPTSS